ncbi:COMM domain-containing protein 2 [Asbolus verrucosus]|uniref:COMM domain-containing protein 2 n=1 Tax=Asbolus verrucosus TaxID=1661398 RepID=A0A482V9A9_ASBVE|nr:COMM domain-containing protein 2 [Asbolus verrucosus]
MLISLRGDHKDHLSLLTTQSTQVLIDFCKLAIDFLQNGPNLKLYGTAAEKLSADLDTVQNCIYGLVNLLLLSCKHDLSEADFRDSILTLGFNSDQQSVLNKFYESKKKEITQIINKFGVKEPHYDDLEWRFEVQVATRTLLQQVTPLITLDLSLKTMNDEGCDYNKEHILLQTDVTNLLYITQELEKALTESRSRHSRKIQRALNN